MFLVCNFFYNAQSKILYWFIDQKAFPIFESTEMVHRVEQGYMGWLDNTD